MKRGTTSSGVRKKQIKMTMRHHKKPTMITKIRKTTTVLNAEGNGGQLELSDKSGRSIITFKNYQYLAGSAKAEHMQTLWPSNATLSRNHRRNVYLCFPKWHAQEFSNQQYLCKSETMNNSHKPDVGYPGRHELGSGSSVIAGGCLQTALSEVGQQGLAWKGTWTTHLCFNQRETDLVIKMITVVAVIQRYGHG